MWGIPDVGLSELISKKLNGVEPANSTQGKGLYNMVEGSDPGYISKYAQQKNDWQNIQNQINNSQKSPSLNRNQNVPIPAGFGSWNKRSSSGRNQNVSGNDAKRARDKREKQLRKSLSHSFSSTIDNYKNLIGYLPNEQANATQQIGNLANTQKQSVNDALSNAMGQYQGYRGEVATNQKKTLQDLAQNTRNAFQAGNNYLGSLGAGNSSATGMYSAALTQQANKNRADVLNQANKEYNDINTSQADTQSKAQQQLDAIDTWKASRTSELMQKYQDLKRQLSTAYAGANDSEKQALSKMDESLFNSAIQNLNNIKAQEQQYRQGVSDWTNQQNQQLQGMVSNVSQPAQNYRVGDISTQNIQALQGTKDNGDGTYTDTTGNKWKKNQDGQYSYLGNVNIQ